VGESISSRLSLGWLSPGPANALVPTAQPPPQFGYDDGYDDGYDGGGYGGDEVAGLHVSDFAAPAHLPPPQRTYDGGDGDGGVGDGVSGVGGVGDFLLTRLGSGLGDAALSLRRAAESAAEVIRPAAELADERNGAAVAARAARAAAVGSAALSAGYVRGSPFDGGGCGGGYGDAEGDREGDTEGDGEEGEGPEADEWRWGGDGGAAAIAPPWLRATSLDRPVKPQLDGPAAQSRELLGQLRSTKHGKGGRQPADVTHRRGTAEWNGAMARLARQRVDGDLLAHRSLTRTRTKTPTPTPTRARARARTLT
jgi:hypothetical protein